MADPYELNKVYRTTRGCATYRGIVEVEPTGIEIPLPSPDESFVSCAQCNSEPIGCGCPGGPGEQVQLPSTLFATPGIGVVTIRAGGPLPCCYTLNPPLGGPVSLGVVENGDERRCQFALIPQEFQCSSWCESGREAPPSDCDGAENPPEPCGCLYPTWNGSFLGVCRSSDPGVYQINTGISEWFSIGGGGQDAHRIATVQWQYDSGGTGDPRGIYSFHNLQLNSPLAYCGGDVTITGIEGSTWTIA